MAKTRLLTRTLPEPQRYRMNFAETQGILLRYRQIPRIGNIHPSATVSY